MSVIRAGRASIGVYVALGGAILGPNHWPLPDSGSLGPLGSPQVGVSGAHQCYGEDVVGMGDAGGAVELLDPRVRGLVEERGWRRLTPVQEQAIPVVLGGANVVIVAPTGVGKTEAAMLPVLSMMVSGGAEPVSVLYITPLRALINDIYERLRWWAERLGFTVARKHGDVPQAERMRRLRRAPHILVTTPESLEIDLDWAPRFRQYYRNLRWVIVDEVHEIVSTKRGAQLAVLLERLRRLAGDFQLIFLSATIGDPALVGRVFAGSSRRRLEVVRVEHERSMEIVVDYVEGAGRSDFWARAARKIAGYIEPLTLVFVNSRYVAERLHEELEKLGGLRVAVHHSSVSGQQKEEVEKLAKEGLLDAIICTKTLELGIDIGSVRRVVLFRPSGSAASLLQRVGRSGHSLHGVSRGIIVAADPIELFEALAEARLAATGRVEAPRIPSKPLDVAARALLGMALSREYSVEEAYEVLRSTPYFEGLTREEYGELVEALVSNRLLKVDEGGLLRPGSMFFKIWRFDSRSDRRGLWWARGFSEFFTLIGERDTFIVKTGEGRVVGELDTDYVYRFLRPGVTIRLAGRTWRVVSVDELFQRVVVAEASEESGAALPTWRGRGPEVTGLVVEETRRVVREVHEGKLWLPENVRLASDARRALEEYLSHMSKYHALPPLEDTVVVERVSDEVALLAIEDERTMRTLAYLLIAKTGEGYARASFYGVSVPLDEFSENPLHTLFEYTSREELEETLRTIVPRTPYFVETARSIQLSFGVLHRLSPSDGIVYREALRQTLETYFNTENAWRLIHEVRTGARRVKASLGGPSVYALQLLREPPERLWSYGLEDIIADSLRGMAFTVEELADMVSAEPETIEAKLKEMSKPGSRHRVFSFIDVDTGEERWALVEDALEIAYSDEFSSSFTPEDTDELYLVIAKSRGKSTVQLMVSTRDLAGTRALDLTEKIPFEEVYELRVMPLSGVYEGKVVRYTNIPRDIAGLLVLNAITVFQKLRQLTTAIY